MIHISLHYGLAKNIYNAAIAHKKDCVTANCNVSIFQLKMAAVELMKFAPRTEQMEFEQWEWPY